MFLILVAVTVAAVVLAKNKKAVNASPTNPPKLAQELCNVPTAGISPTGEGAYYPSVGYAPIEDDLPRPLQPNVCYGYKRTISPGNNPFAFDIPAAGAQLDSGTGAGPTVDPARS
jgi:hypothetical protein